MDRSTELPATARANADSEFLNLWDWRVEERPGKAATVRMSSTMSRASTIRPDQPLQHAATALTMVPLLLWSSFTSFGYFCRDGRYEPFCLAVDCCGGAHTSPNSALEGGGCCRTLRWLANPDARGLATTVAGLATKGLIEFDFGYETSCQPVLKQPGICSGETWVTGRDKEAAGPHYPDCSEGLVAAAFLIVETASLSCGRLDDLVIVLQRCTI